MRRLRLAIVTVVVTLIIVPIAIYLGFLYSGGNSASSDPQKAKADASAVGQDAGRAKTQAPERKEGSDAEKAADGADATVKAIADAVANGEPVERVLLAAQRMVDAHKLLQDAAGAQSAQAVSSAAHLKSQDITASTQDIADEANAWSDAIKRAAGRLVDGSAAEPAAGTDSRYDFTRDLPPASATAAFESVLGIDIGPALYAVGDYEYSIYATTPTIESSKRKNAKPRPSGPSTDSRSWFQVQADRDKPRRMGFFALKYETHF